MDILPITVDPVAAVPLHHLLQQSIDLLLGIGWIVQLPAHDFHQHAEEHPVGFIRLDLGGQLQGVQKIILDILRHIVDHPVPAAQNAVREERHIHQRLMVADDGHVISGFGAHAVG